MHPPPKEKATRQGGSLKTDSADTVAKTQPACKRELPPADGADEVDDYARRQRRMDREYLVACREAGIEPDVSCRTNSQNFAGDGTVARGFDGDASVPCSMPPEEEKPLTKEDVLYLTIGRGCEFAQGHPGKWEAWLIATGYNLDSAAETARRLKIEPRTFQNYVKSARTWFENLRAEMEAKP
jgi:hypothetical protein